MLSNFLHSFYSYSIFQIKKQWKDERDKTRKKDHTKLETYEAGYGTKSKNSPEEMDKVQPLSTHFQGIHQIMNYMKSDHREWSRQLKISLIFLAIDAVYFNGANADGFYVVTATARRPHGVVNGFLIIT